MKGSNLIFAIVLMSQFAIYNLQPLKAQPFEMAFGGTGSDIGWSMVQTIDGGYAMGGHTNSYGAGNYDVYVVKVDAAGNIQWTRTVGGAGDDQSFSIIQTTDSGYAIAGRTNSYGAGNYDMYVVKLDVAGNLQWTRTVGGSNSDDGWSLVQTSDGGYAIAGATNSYGPPGSEAMYVVKLDAAGAVQWTRTISKTNNNYAKGIIQTSGGGYTICGYSFAVPGNRDIYIAHLDAAGVLQWTLMVAGAGTQDVSWSIIETTAGGCVIGAYTNSYGAGGMDVYLIKIDVNGVLQWTKTIGGTGDDYGYRIIKTADSGYAITGHTNSYGAGNYDVYVVKVDSAGNNQWTRAIGGAGDDYSYSIIQTTDGGYSIAGRTNSYGAGNDDVYMVKLDASGNSCMPTGTGGIAGSGGTTSTGGATGSGGIANSGGVTGMGGIQDTICYCITTTGNTNTSICQGDSIFLGGSFQTAAGNYNDTIVGGNSLGCDSVVITALTINPVATGNANTTICQGDSIFLGGSFQTAAGNYNDTIIGGSSLGCDSIVTTALTISPVATGNTNTSICQGDSIFLGGSFQTTTGIYNDTIIGGSSLGCDSVVTTTLAVLPVATGNTNTSICQGDSIFLGGSFQTTAGIYNDTIVGGSSLGCDSISSFILTVIPTAITNINVTGCDSILVNGSWYSFSQVVSDTISTGSSTGCDSITNVTITISTTPVLTVYPMTDSIYAGSTITLNAAGAAVYFWDNGSTTSSVTVNPLQNTNYCVIGINGNCQDTVCAMIYVIDCAGRQLFIPTAFSPNRDGQNDELCIYGADCIKTIQLNIYDRWGELVYQSTDPADCWDGTFRDKQLDGAVFAFVLNAVSTADEQIKISGNITLVK